MQKLFSEISNDVLSFPRGIKRLIAVLVDASLCVLTVWLAYYLRLGELVKLSDASLFSAIISVLIAVSIFALMGLYRAIFRFSGLLALKSVAQAVAVYGLLYSSIIRIT